MCYVAITPEAFVCERHQETLKGSPMAKEILVYPHIDVIPAVRPASDNMDICEGRNVPITLT